MNARFFFISSLVLLSLISESFSAEGIYQRTKDGKTIVWNNHPLPGDASEWLGERDSAGYATGRGTLTWFTTEQKVLTGSHIPMAKHIAASRYTGDMNKGKFDGMVVNVDANGRTFHGTFIDGHKGKDWAMGAAPASNQISPKEKQAAPVIAASPKPAESPEMKIAERSASPPHQSAEIGQPDIEPPAEGPPESQIRASTKRPQPNEKPASGAVVEAPTEYDDSLRSLVGPPSGLRSKAEASASLQPSASPQASVAPKKIEVAAPSAPPSKLNAAAVIEISDSEARAHGYNLGEFQHPQAQYNAIDDTWTVLYDRKSVDGNGMAAVGQRFSISIEDKSKKATFAPEK